MGPTSTPQELSFPLPKNPHTILQAHLTFFETSMMLFLTTSTIGESSSALAPMGSFVYAMPNVCRPHRGTLPVWQSSKTAFAKFVLTENR